MSNLRNDTGTAIARQSSLKFVIEYLNMIEVPLPLNATVGISEVITEYVINGRTSEVKDRLERFDNYIKEGVADDIVDRLKFELSQETK